MWHFIHVFQGCYHDWFHLLAALLFIYRIIQLTLLAFISDVKNAFHLQLVLCVVYLLLFSSCHPYKKWLLLDVLDVFMGDLALHNSQHTNKSASYTSMIVLQLIC